MKQIEHAKNKLNSTLQLVTRLKDNDYPHDHVADVLDHFQAHLQERVDAVEDLDPALHVSVVNARCIEALASVAEVFPILGYLNRSTNVNNPFELHGPFFRLFKKALGENAKLIIFPEWEYSPFTYEVPDELHPQNIVLIGVPASESENGLVIPLAGHELGHCIWSKSEYQEKYNAKLQDKVPEFIIDEKWKEFSEEFDLSAKNDLYDDMFGSECWTSIWEWACAQCEELFCDFVGLLMFRESYLHAFAYFVSPGLSGNRSSLYPELLDRVNALEIVACKYGIDVPDGYANQFENFSPTTDSMKRLMLEVSDGVTQSEILCLAQDANEFIQSTGIDAYSAEEVDRLVENFSLGVPAIKNPIGLSTIVNAAWKFSNDEISSWDKTYPMLKDDPIRKKRMLSDLIFKSIEVLETYELNAAL